MPGAPIRRPEIIELETFLAAATEGSLARAGEQLGISKTAATKRIDSLEALAGHRLLTRGPRGVTLTRHGRRLVPIAESLLAEANRAFTGLSAIRVDQDPLRIGGLLAITGASAPSTEYVLQQTERLLAEVFHHIDEGITIGNPEDRRIIEVNDAFCRMVGFQREELLGRTRRELGVVLTAESEQALRHLVEAGQVAEYLVDGTTKDGRRTRLAFKAKRVVIGGRERLVTTVRDITEDMARKEMLLRQSAQQRALVDLSLAALSGESIDTTLEGGAELIRTHVTAYRAAIWQRADESSIALRSLADPAPTCHVGQTLCIPNPLLADLQPRPPDVVADLANDTRFESSQFRADGMRSAAIIPIQSHDELYGLITAVSPDVAHFTEPDVDFMSAAANLFALMLRGDQTILSPAGPAHGSRKAVER